MRPQSVDTDPEIDAKLFAHYRAIGPAGRAQRFNAVCNYAAALALAGLRIRHPEADDRELRLRLASTYIDAETMRAAYGWAPGD